MPRWQPLSLPMPGKGHCTKEENSTRTPEVKTAHIHILPWSLGDLYKSVASHHLLKKLLNTALPVAYTPILRMLMETRYSRRHTPHNWRISERMMVLSLQQGGLPPNGTVMGLSVQNSSDFGFRRIVLRKHTIWLNFKMTLCLLLWWVDWAWGIAVGDLENNAPESISISEFIGLHRRNSRWLHSSLIHFGNLKYLQILKNTLTTGLEE